MSTANVSNPIIGAKHKKNQFLTLLVSCISNSMYIFVAV